MKYLLFCDDTNYQEVTSLAKQNTVGIEYQSFHDPDILDNPNQVVQEHAKALQDISNTSMHGAFPDLCPGSCDALVRELTKKRMMQSIAIAQELKTNNIVFHGGYVPGTSSPANYIKRSVQFWKELLEEVPSTMQLHLENMLDDTPEILSSIVTQVGDNRLGICLDIGHAHCRSKVSPLEWVKALGSAITYVHIHDNHGQEDEHLGLGQGTIPAFDVLTELEKVAPNAIWAIEAENDGLLQSFNWLKEKNFI